MALHWYRNSPIVSNLLLNDEGCALSPFKCLGYLKFTKVAFYQIKNTIKIIYCEIFIINFSILCILKEIKVIKTCLA